MRTTAIREGKSVLGKMLQYPLVCNQYAITTQAEVISFLRPLLLFFGYVLVDLWPHRSMENVKTLIDKFTVDLKGSGRF